MPIQLLLGQTPRLVEVFEKVNQAGLGAKVIEEIVLQSRVEFNVEAEEQDILAFQKSESDTGGKAT